MIFEKTTINHTLENPHKLCDFKPMYGHIFEDYLNKYNYWGHCDMDIIWGNMGSFLKSIQFQNFDIISTRPNAISGHFTIYRNTELLKYYYLQVPNYRNAFTELQYQGFDEGYFSYHIFCEIRDKKLDVKPFWEKRNSIDRGELAQMPNGWYWKKGEIRNIWGLKGNYLHLIDWKNSIEEVNLSNKVNYTSFKISKFGIWESTIPFKYRQRMFFDFAIPEKWGFFKSKIRQLLGSKELRNNTPNVLKEYSVLK